jgi:hypothetical protein
MASTGAETLSSIGDDAFSQAIRPARPKTPHGNLNVLTSIED